MFFIKFAKFLFSNAKVLNKNPYTKFQVTMYAHTCNFEQSEKSHIRVKFKKH